MAHYPGGDSIKTFIQLFLGIRNDGFYRYDYSKSGKLEPYNFSNAANIPILLIHGNEDLFIVPEDGLWGYNQLMNAQKNVRIKFYDYLGHMSVVTASNYTKIFLDDSYSFLLKSSVNSEV